MVFTCQAGYGWQCHLRRKKAISCAVSAIEQSATAVTTEQAGGLQHTRLAQDGVPMCVYEEAPWIGTASAAVDRLARRVMRASTSGGGWYGPCGIYDSGCLSACFAAGVSTPHDIWTLTSPLACI